MIAPIFLPGSHPAKNTSDSEAVVIFVEPLPKCFHLGVMKPFVAPSVCSPICHKIHAENVDWIAGQLNLEPGASGAQHQDKGQPICVLEGEEIAIYPGGDMDELAVVPVKPIARVLGRRFRHPQMMTCQGGQHILFSQAAALGSAGS